MGGYNEFIYVCHHCSKPTYFNRMEQQTPGALFGDSVNHLPDSIEKL